jgi:DNA-binding MurR/RpiR family transcriptional regulator
MSDYQSTPLVMLQIKKKYTEFNPVMKQIADYLFNSADQIQYVGISKLAEACQVSVASITRFVHLIGFPNFKAFQFEMIKSLVNGDKNGQIELPNKIVFEYGGTSPQDSVEEIAKRVFQSNIQMISETMQTIDYHKMEKITELIVKARNLVFLGVGRSAVTAESGRIRFNRLGINSFAYADTQEQIVAATTCTKDDVFIGISNYGRSATVVNNIYQAKLRGATTVGVTSADGSPLAQTADISFITACNPANREFLTHKQAFEPACENIAQMVLLDCIYMNVALKQDKSCFDMFYNTVKILSKERI